MNVGADVGIVDGVMVGLNVTRLTPAPVMTAFPEQSVRPVQPSRMTYVWVAVPTGTVYCTCAHTLPPEMHCAGGRSPVPVSS